MHHHGGSDGTVDGDDGDWAAVRTDGENDKGDPAPPAVSVSTNTKRSSCPSLYFHKYHCQCAGAWMGLYPGRIKGDGGLGKVGIGQRHEPGRENGMEREQETRRMYEIKQEIEKKEEKKIGMCPQERRASNEMCTFLILNISSLQLIPVNMIAYRSQYGSTNPAGIIAPALVATTVSTLAAILFCKIKDQ